MIRVLANAAVLTLIFICFGAFILHQIELTFLASLYFIFVLDISLVLLYGPNALSTGANHLGIFLYKDKIFSSFHGMKKTKADGYFQIYFLMLCLGIWASSFFICLDWNRNWQVGLKLISHISWNYINILLVLASSEYLWGECGSNCCFFQYCLLLSRLPFAFQ